jgi:hypothetical protein
MTESTPPKPHAAGAHGALDINDAFRGGGRSVEFLDWINKASVVMLAETGIVRNCAAADSVARAWDAAHNRWWALAPAHPPA